MSHICFAGHMTCEAPKPRTLCTRPAKGHGIVLGWALVEEVLPSQLKRCAHCAAAFLWLVHAGTRQCPCLHERVYGKVEEAVGQLRHEMAPYCKVPMP